MPSYTLVRDDGLSGGDCGNLLLFFDFYDRDGFG